MSTNQIFSCEMTLLDVGIKTATLERALGKPSAGSPTKALLEFYLEETGDAQPARSENPLFEPGSGMKYRLTLESIA